MEYIVKVSGVEQVEHLDKALTSLEAVLGSAKGSGKGLEEVRKIITGFKGQAGVFKELSDGVKGFNTSIDRVVTSVNDLGSRLHGDLKREFGTLNAVMQNALLGGGNGMMAKSIGQKLTREIGMGITQAAAAAASEGGAAITNAARKLRKESTAAYNELIDSDPKARLTASQLWDVEALRRNGAEVSAFHRNQLAELKSAQKKEREENAKHAVKLRESYVTGAYSSLSDRGLHGTKGQLSELDAFLNPETLDQKIARWRDSAKSKIEGAYSSIFTQASHGNKKQLDALDAFLNPETFDQKIVRWRDSVKPKVEGAYSSIFSQALHGNKAQIKAYEASISSLFKPLKLDAAKIQTQKATAEYNKLVGANPYQSLDAEQMVALARLKDSGAKISKFHNTQLENLRAYQAQERKQLASQIQYKLSLAKQAKAKADKDLQEHISVNKRAAEAGKLAYAELTGGSYDRTLDKLQLKKLKDIAAVSGSSFIAPAHKSQLAAMLKAEKEITAERKVQKELSYKELAARTASQLYRSTVSSPTEVLTKAQLAQIDAAAKLGGTSAMSQLHVGQLSAYRKELKETAEAGKETGKSFVDMGKHAKDTHGAVRGLASGFNLLWLTWGSLVPLMAGAAISNGFMKTVKEGMRFSHLMTVIGSLGEVTTETMNRLSDSVLELGKNSVYGPVELAEAMKTLVLAGLDAEAAAKSLNSVMNFAVAGDTNIQNAADVLVSVTTAFGTGAEGFVRTSDIIVRAAADSKASVESFGEAMKTASVIGKQYGATQEDVAASISMLANLGIQGSAAGTAIRNFYADLSGRNFKVQGILKELNLDFKDLNGNMLPLVDIADKLNQKLKTLSPKAAKDLMQVLLSERGGKIGVPILSEINEMVSVGGEMISKLELRIRSLRETAGDAAVNAITIGNSTESSWKKAGNALKTSLEQVFKGIEPQIASLAVSMQRLFNSPEFLSTMQVTMTTLATLGKAFGDNVGIITSAIGVYGALKLGMIAKVGVMGLLTKSYTTLTASTAAAGIALRGWGAGALLASGAAAKLADSNKVLALSNAAAAASTVGAGAAVRGLIGAIPVLGAAYIAASFAIDAYTAAVNRKKQAENAEKVRAEDNTKAIREDAAKYLEEAKLKQEAFRNGKDSEADIKISRTQLAALENTKVFRDGLIEVNKEIAELERKRDKEASQALRDRDGNLMPSAVITKIDAQLNAKQKEAEELGKKVSEIYKSFDEAANDYRKGAEIDSVTGQERAAKEQAEDFERRVKIYMQTFKMSRKAAEEEARKVMQSGGLELPDPRTPSLTRGYYDKSYEEKAAYLESARKLQKYNYDLGILDAQTYYANLKKLAEEEYANEKAGLSARISAFSSKSSKDDPSAAKEAADATVKLGNLKTAHAQELLNLQKDLNKALAEEEAYRDAGVKFGEKYLAAMRQNAEDSANALLLTDREQELAKARREVVQDFYAEALKYAEEYNKKLAELGRDATEKEATEQAKRLQDLKDRELLAIQAVTDAERLKEQARRNSGAGYSRAMKDMRDETTNFNEHAYNLTKTTANGMADSLTEFAVSGKSSFADLANTIVREMVRIAMQRAVLGLLDMFGGFGNAAGGLTGSLTSSASSSGFSSMSSVDYSLASGSGAPGIKLAKGGVVSSPSLSTYSNQVHSTPKFFAFAQGGVFGEAGPEAVMPLTRGADGNLGVRTYGGGTSRSNSGVIVNVEVINNGSPVAATQQTSTNEDGEVFVRMILDTVNNDIQKGGRTARTVKQRFNLKG